MGKGLKLWVKEIIFNKKNRKIKRNEWERLAGGSSCASKGLKAGRLIK